MRVRIDGEIYDVNEEIALEKNKKHTIEVIVDRLIVREGIDMQYMPAYLIGTAVAMVSGIGAISLLKYISKNSKFGGFAYYCWVAGGIFLVLSLLGVTFVHA